MRRFLSFFALSCVIVCQAQVKTFNVSVTNPLKTDRTDQPVKVALADYGTVTSAIVITDGTEVPCQLVDFNQDDCFDQLCFVVDLKGKETRQYTVTLNDGPQHDYPARVYAEMVMRNDKVKEKNRHNNYVESLTARGDCAYSYNLLHHHGVCFESELNGIRIYFDKRQTLDLYGKFQKRLELQQTQFYTSDAQKQEGYGDDVLWVGNTFGLGAFRGWDGKEPTMIDPVRNRTQRIIGYGPVCTVVEVIDRGWLAPDLSQDTTPQPIDMTLRYTQWAGHRDTDVEVFFKEAPVNHQFSTGIINVKGSEEFSDHRGLRACWGTDYPSTDTLKWKPETVGLAILLNKENIVSEEPANKDNYAFVVAASPNPQTSNLNPQPSNLNYKVAYCSANESFGFHSAQEWFDWLKLWRKEVENPVQVNVY